MAKNDSLLALCPSKFSDQSSPDAAHPTSVTPPQ
jgi:hypothetical protein